MSYRDDGDALLSRAEALQREVDELKAKLAEKQSPSPQLFADRDTGRHFGQPTKAVAPAEDSMRMLIGQLGGLGTNDAREVSAYPRLPDPPEAAVRVEPDPGVQYRDRILDLTRARLGGLTHEQLVLIGAVIEALFEERKDVMIALRDAARLATTK